MAISWGLPPKFQLIKELNNTNVAIINNRIVSILKANNFDIKSIQEYNVQARKKMPHTVLSILSFGRPFMQISILISKKGKLTVQSLYVYNSRMGSTCFDSGKQHKIISSMIEELTTQLRN